ncbi:MAG: DUF4214 domain-containing protein [Actinomycetia bacterium]|nr:DUF4214 domain-containing protein [Actinomycetes bacterium]
MVKQGLAALAFVIAAVAAMPQASAEGPEIVVGIAGPTSHATTDFVSPCPEMHDSIYRLYRAYFLREPDQAGWNYWTVEYGGRHNSNLEVVSDSFAISDEFQARYGGLDNQQFVSLIYQNVLGRTPDPEGLAHWTNALDSGYSRGAVMIAFSESAEYVLKTGTTPPLAGYLQWYDRLLYASCGSELPIWSGVASLSLVPGTPSTHSDVYIWNYTSETRVVTVRYQNNYYYWNIVESIELPPNYYLYVYNVPAPEGAASLTISKTDPGGAELRWVINHYDHPHSSDRPGWIGENFLALSTQDQGPAGGLRVGEAKTLAGQASD